MKISREALTHPLFPHPLVYLFAQAACSLCSFTFFLMFVFPPICNGKRVLCQSSISVEAMDSVVRPLAVGASSQCGGRRQGN